MDNMREGTTPAVVTPASEANVQENVSSAQDYVLAQMQQALEQMYQRQHQLETELADTRAALKERGLAAQAAESKTTNTLLAELLQRVPAETGQETTGPRDWKPPTWDGKAESFRDYLVRLRSSYVVRSSVKPTLSVAYYWDTIYGTLPARERARMRHYWEKGGTSELKDPEEFFTQLEQVFADSNEKAKALEELTTLKHTHGQPWHEHQLEFDGLLLTAGGNSWEGSAKIATLKNTFSNAAKMYTASVVKTEDYYKYAEEVERVMTNLETTDQFKAANRKWSKEKGRAPAPNNAATTRYRTASPNYRVDADGDTLMTATRTSGQRNSARGGVTGHALSKAMPRRMLEDPCSAQTTANVPPLSTLFSEMEVLSI